MKTIVDFTNKIKEKFTMRKDIAPVESSSTASRAYSAGDNFYYGSLLQKATTDIAQGASLVGGTNFENADPVCTTLQNLSTEVTSVKETLTNQINKNGAKNLLPFDLATVKSSNTEGTWSGSAYTIKGVTFTPTFDDKGNLLYVNVNGTATGNIWFTIGSFHGENGKSYIMSGCPSGGGSNKYYIIYYQPPQYLDYGAPITFTSNGSSYNVIIYINNGQTVSNLDFYPMIRLASDPDGTYEPYAMTNRQLTEDLNDLNKLKTTTITSVLNSTVNDGTLSRRNNMISLYLDFTVNTGISAWALLLRVPEEFRMITTEIMGYSYGTTPIEVRCFGTNNEGYIWTNTSLTAGSRIRFTFMGIAAD